MITVLCTFVGQFLVQVLVGGWSGWAQVRRLGARCVHDKRGDGRGAGPWPATGHGADDDGEVGVQITCARNLQHNLIKIQLILGMLNSYILKNEDKLRI